MSRSTRISGSCPFAAEAIPREQAKATNTIRESHSRVFMKLCPFQPTALFRRLSGHRGLLEEERVTAVPVSARDGPANTSVGRTDRGKSWQGRSPAHGKVWQAPKRR